jgi:hypothetical protein
MNHEQPDVAPDDGETFDAAVFQGLFDSLQGIPTNCGDPEMQTICGMLTAAVDMKGGTRLLLSGIPSVLDSVALRICLALLQEVEEAADPAIRELVKVASSNLDYALQIRCGELTDKGRRLAARHLQ